MKVGRRRVGKVVNAKSSNLRQNRMRPAQPLTTCFNAQQCPISVPTKSTDESAPILHSFSIPPSSAPLLRNLQPPKLQSARVQHDFQIGGLSAPRGARPQSKGEKRKSRSKRRRKKRMSKRRSQRYVSVYRLQRRPRRPDDPRGALSQRRKRKPG